MVDRPPTSQLDRIERTLEALVERLDAELNGRGEKAGIKVRLDRLEQSEVRRVYWSRTVAATAVGAVIISIWNFLTGSRP